MVMKPPCSIPGCSRPVTAKGLCPSHYQTQRMASIRAGERAKPRFCRHCGLEFAGRSPRAVFCSLRCKELAHYKSRRVGSEAPRALACVVCAAPFTTLNPRVECCSLACTVRNQNAKAAARKAATAAAARADRPPCIRCGGVIPDARKMGSITCSAECSIANSRARQKAGASASNRRYLYGISPEQFEALIQAQGGGCGVCGTSEWSGKGRAPHVDHDHATGAVRGVLCHHCNLMLGNAKDDPALLRAAADYLERPMPLP